MDIALPFKAAISGSIEGITGFLHIPGTGHRSWRALTTNK